jgi:methylenetetrahydrofolate reductase (NADPH)
MPDKLIMKLSNHYGEGQFGLSFEVFPPKTPKGLEALWRHVAELMVFKPGFMTCTYGAGGSTRDKTLDIAARIHDEHGIPVAAHLTCVGSTVDELRNYLSDAHDRGIEYIVALRGDPPEGEDRFVAVDGGLSYANELVTMIRQEYADFGIAVAGYPETHQEAVSADADLENLKRKIDSGADCVFTQLFYSNDDFFRFRDRCTAIGIDVPIIPGILPVTSAGQLQRVVSNCGAELPPALLDDLNNATNEDTAFEIGIAYSVQQVQALMDAGAPGLHVYVLNKSQTTSAMLSQLALDTR